MLTVVAMHFTRVTTYYPRRGRVSPRHDDALNRLFPQYGVRIPGPPIEPATLFGRVAPLVLEIGSGMGDATVTMASADPSRDYLAVEVFPPGLGNLLAVVEESGLTNVRVGQGDALVLVDTMLAPGSLDAIHVFFPDPWPKVRHHKRRLIQRVNAAHLVRALRPGGTLHCATDWPHYAQQMLEVLGADPELAGGAVPRPEHRPITKFEQRALEAGRPVTDLIYVKGP
jgi:tRNA (guanine-N7-)-methyltransferase